MIRPAMSALNRGIKAGGSFLFRNPKQYEIGKNGARMLIEGSGELMGPGSIAGRLGPDALFASLAFMQNPGDFWDKSAAAGTQFIGGGLGGLALGRAADIHPALSKLGYALDMAGSIGGDYAGMWAGDQVQRAKDKLTGGEGLTAWERMGAKEQQEFAENLEQQILAQYGLIPGSREQYVGMV